VSLTFGLLAASCSGSDTHGTRIASLPMLWLGGKGLAKPSPDDPIPLVVFDHPCLFRQTALQTLEGKRRRWRLSLTTPSLPGVWAALRSGYGISVRPARPVPAGIRNVGPEFGLPQLPPIELRMLTASELSPAASDLRDILGQVVRRRRSRGAPDDVARECEATATRGARRGMSPASRQ
jgi:DNA-binding transcriptional LysR family regulator